jgi:predicted Zn finger-like uncharacterized protein
MYSQCPECQTRFRVTADALRAARGTVRCGRCGSAFDALVRLTDTLPEEDDQARNEAMIASPSIEGLGLGASLDGSNADLQLASTGEQPAVTEFHFSAEDIEQVFVDARDWQRRFGASEAPPAGLPAGDDASDQSARDAGGDFAADAARAAQAGPPVVVHEPEAVEDITMEGERIVIEGVTGFEDEFLDDLQHHDAVPLPSSQAAPTSVDLEATDRFEILKHVPDSAYPEDEAEHTHSTPPLPAELLGEAEASPPLDAPAPTPAALAPSEPVVEQTLQRAPQRPAASEAPNLSEADPLLAPAPWRRDATRPVDHLEAFEEQSRGARARLGWSIVAVLLALVLGAQLVHHFRDELARDVTVGPLVREAYARLGLPLAPSWDPALFEVRQWGADATQADGPGLMTVRASLRNRAGFAQPMPLLRLELENRFGDTVARRDFEPGEYLKDPAQATRLLEPGGAVEAELDLVAVGSEAVGYRLDACMRDDRSAVRCALAPDKTASQ